MFFSNATSYIYFQIIEAYNRLYGFEQPYDNYILTPIPLSIEISFIHSYDQALLFSAHISYGKGKYLNQTVFFLQNLPSTKFIFTLKGVTHRIQLT